MRLLKNYVEQLKKDKKNKQELKRRWEQEPLKKVINAYVNLYILKVIIAGFLLFYCMKIVSDVSTINELLGTNIKKETYFEVFMQYASLIFLLTIISFILSFYFRRFNFRSELTYKSYRYQLFELIEIFSERFLKLFVLLPLAVIVFFYVSNNLSSGLTVTVCAISYLVVRKCLSRQSNRVAITYRQSTPDKSLAKLEPDVSSIIYTPDVNVTVYGPPFCKEESHEVIGKGINNSLNATPNLKIKKNKEHD